MRITLPGDQMNLQGVDMKQTAVYGNDDGNSCWARKEDFLWGNEEL